MAEMLIKMINNPQEIDGKKILELISECCQSKNLQFVYDGPNFCQLSGEIIGEKQTIKLNTNRISQIVVLKDQLRELINKNCFYNDYFEPAFQRIYNITILNFNNIDSKEQIEIPYIDITDEILNQVFTGDELEAIKQKQLQHYKQIYQYPYLENEVDFCCPITQEKCLSFLEGINLQGYFFSVDGAIKVLETQSNKLFPHQIEYLQIQKTQINQRAQQQCRTTKMSEKNLNDQMIFKCPQTQKSYFICFEGIKFENQNYSLEGLIQLYEKSPNIIKNQLKQNPLLIEYIEKVRNGQKYEEEQCSNLDQSNQF
ncbi:unnamed protein product [Paramecium sonneborni]|uniref:Uncharacterized protein n=1 Tax=Paramecium sonneborni TaxID=65129 RepID=A0A8S1LWJ5_9CILI|nr:unnamed protein product [Paramecium sonneborni]